MSFTKPAGWLEPVTQWQTTSRNVVKKTSGTSPVGINTDSKAPKNFKPKLIANPGFLCGPFLGFLEESQDQVSLVLRLRFLLHVWLRVRKTEWRGKGLFYSAVMDKDLDPCPTGHILTQLTYVLEEKCPNISSQPFPSLSLEVNEAFGLPRLVALLPQLINCSWGTIHICQEMGAMPAFNSHRVGERKGEPSQFHPAGREVSWEPSS